MCVITLGPLRECQHLGHNIHNHMHHSPYITYTHPLPYFRKKGATSRAARALHHLHHLEQLVRVSHQTWRIPAIVTMVMVMMVVLLTVIMVMMVMAMVMSMAMSMTTMITRGLVLEGL